MNPTEAYRFLVRETRNFFRKSGFSKSVLGMSGGLDSTMTAHILVDALGEKNVTALMMPEKGLSSRENFEDAVSTAKKLGIKYHVQPINSMVKPFRKLSWKQGKKAGINVKPRARMMILYNFANSNNALVAGTGNKSELLLGYFTKYGDGGADILPIGGVYKTDLRKIAEWKKIPRAIIEKIPTAELFKGQTDEGEMGISYAEADEILKKLHDRKISARKLKKEFGSRAVELIVKRVEKNRHKAGMPFIIKIGKL